MPRWRLVCRPCLSHGSSSWSSPLSRRRTFVRPACGAPHEGAARRAVALTVRSFGGRLHRGFLEGGLPFRNNLVKRLAHERAVAPMRAGPGEGGCPDEWRPGAGGGVSRDGPLLRADLLPVGRSDGKKSPKSEDFVVLSSCSGRKMPGRRSRGVVGKRVRVALFSDFGDFSPSERPLSAKPPSMRTCARRIFLGPFSIIGKTLDCHKTQSGVQTVDEMRSMLERANALVEEGMGLLA